MKTEKSQPTLLQQLFDPRLLKRASHIGTGDADAGDDTLTLTLPMLRLTYTKTIAGWEVSLDITAARFVGTEWAEPTDLVRGLHVGARKQTPQDAMVIDFWGAALAESYRRRQDVHKEEITRSVDVITHALNS